MLRLMSPRPEYDQCHEAGHGLNAARHGRGLSAHQYDNHSRIRWGTHNPHRRVKCEMQATLSALRAPTREANLDSWPNMRAPPTPKSKVMGIFSLYRSVFQEYLTRPIPHRPLILRLMGWASRNGGIVWVPLIGLPVPPFDPNSNQGCLFSPAKPFLGIAGLDGSAPRLLHIKPWLSRAGACQHPIPRRRDPGYNQVGAAHRTQIPSPGLPRLKSTADRPGERSLPPGSLPCGPLGRFLTSARPRAWFDRMKPTG